jgi:DNA-binding transcriptional MerR regulator
LVSSVRKKNGGKKQMKTTHKKIIGGLLVGMLIATVGVVLATEQDDDTSSDTINTLDSKPSFDSRLGMCEFGLFGSELTDEQQTELEDLMTGLREQNATHDEIQIAIQEKLDEFGVFDKRLDSEIAQTEQRLSILTRQKELRDEGYNWTEINSIIQDEFGLENAIGLGWDMIGGHDFRHGSCGGPQEFLPPKDSKDAYQ